MQILVAGLTILALFALLNRLRRFRPDSVSASWMNAAFAIRLVAGFALMAVYTFYYTERSDSDTWKYFDDAMTIRSWWPEHPGIVLRFLFGIGLDDPAMSEWKDRLIGWNTRYTYGLPYDYRTIVRLQLVLSVVTFGHYAAHAAWMALFGLIGSVAAYRAFLPFWRHAPALLFLILSLLPSLIFWTSGVSKEAPAWMAVGLFLLAFLSWVQGTAGRNILIAGFASVMLLTVLKPYVGICLLPGVLSVALWKLAGRKRLMFMFAAVHVLSALAALFSRGINSAGNLIHVLSRRREDFYHVAAAKKAGSVVSIPEPDSAFSLLIHFPEAFAVTYLRPWPWEAHSLPEWAAAGENLIVAAMLVFAVMRFRIPDSGARAVWLMCISFAVISAVIIGFSVPVLGAAVRYRFAAIALLCIAAGMSIRPGSVKFSAYFLKRPAS
jgi:hypothetical protein